MGSLGGPGRRVSGRRLTSEASSFALGSGPASRQRAVWPAPTLPGSQFPRPPVLMAMENSRRVVNRAGPSPRLLRCKLLGGRCHLPTIRQPGCAEVWVSHTGSGWKQKRVHPVIQLDSPAPTLSGGNSVAGSVKTVATLSSSSPNPPLWGLHRVLLGFLRLRREGLPASF